MFYGFIILSYWVCSVCIHNREVPSVSDLSLVQRLTFLHNNERRHTAEAALAWLQVKYRAVVESSNQSSGSAHICICVENWRWLKELENPVRKIGITAWLTSWLKTYPKTLEAIVAAKGNIHSSKLKIRML